LLEDPSQAQDDMFKYSRRHAQATLSSKNAEEMMIRFFENHHYFTATSNNKRSTEKQQRLTELKQKFSLQYGL